MARAAAAATSLMLLFLISMALQASIALSFVSVLNTSGDSRYLDQAEEQAHEVHCSRERSRAAWEIIDEYLMPFVEQEDYQLPHTCRLHSENDMFRDQEEHRVHVDINEWKCGYCKKTFRGEKYLDKHFDTRHYDLLKRQNGGKCLADLCGALHCDFIINAKSTKTKCNPAAAARNLHLCESLADKCFPVSQGSSASRLHEFFLRQFCDAHSCTGKKKPFPKGGKKHTNILYLAISILTLMLLPIFYLILYLSQRDVKGRQELKRIKRSGLKTKPS